MRNPETDQSLITRNGRRPRETRPEALPNQIRERSELEVGREYIAVLINKRLEHVEMFRVKVLSEPFQGENGGWWVDTETLASFGRNSSTGARSLVELGIEPYLDSGKPLWNSTTYLTRTQARK